jgi:hypothetical protein
MFPCAARAHFLALLEGHGNSLPLFPDAHDAAVPQVTEFDVRHFPGLAKVRRSKRQVPRRGIFTVASNDRTRACSIASFIAAVVAGFVAKGTVCTDIEGTRRNWSPRSPSNPCRRRRQSTAAPDQASQLDRKHQGGLPVGRASVQIRTLGDQQGGRYLLAAAEHRVLQRRPSVGIDLGTLIDQALYSIDSGLECAKQQGCIAELVAPIDVGAIDQQRLDQGPNARCAPLSSAAYYPLDRQY